MNDENEAHCIYCNNGYPKERADIGYPYCMKKDCSEKGKQNKKAVEFSWTEADTARF